MSDKSMKAVPSAKWMLMANLLLSACNPEVQQEHPLSEGGAQTKALIREVQTGGESPSQSARAQGLRQTLVNDPIPYFQSLAGQTRAVVTGDFNGDGRTDIAAAGFEGWTDLPVAIARGNGSFEFASGYIPSFQTSAAQARLVVTGDFNKDGRTDIAAVGGNNWQSLPVALASGNAGFQLVNGSISNFQTWAMQTHAVVTGDFDGDGRTDIAAVGANNWQNLPVALSNGNGTFRLVNAAIPSFQTSAYQARVVMTGDFNGDGRTDIAAVGGNNWQSLPVALSNGDGSFRLINGSIPNFQTLAVQSSTVVVGDFNGDGLTDIAAVGGDDWQTLPVALAKGDGTFRFVGGYVASFQNSAYEARTVAVGDFNGDGRTDIAAVGGNNWQTMPVALASGDGLFQLSNEPIAYFQSWAMLTRSVVTGDFDGNGRTDIAAVGAKDWQNLPVVLFN